MYRTSEMREQVAFAEAEPFAIIIPARFGSTRFPGKPLAALRGARGEARSLIERSWIAAVQIGGRDRVWVATDDPGIAAVVRGFGGQVVMTPGTCRNGTERCAAALAALGDIAPIVVNFQGDAPLTPGHVVPDLVAALIADPDAAMATAALRCSPSTYAHLLADQAAGRVGGTTVTFTEGGRALYFSKRVIPHGALGAGHSNVHLHLGVYAFRPAALAAYAALPPSLLEQAEGLEQLRFLEAGLPVRVVPVDGVGWDCIELNNPQDVAPIEAVLMARGIA